MKNFEDINRLQILAIGFPSPCGEMGMKNNTEEVPWEDESGVSVPLRGNGYEKRQNMKGTCLHISAVSVPLRGNGYEKQPGMSLVYILGYMFPSPCGEMGMKNLQTLAHEIVHCFQFVSVPLRGNGYEKR